MAERKWNQPRSLYNPRRRDHVEPINHSKPTSTTQKNMQNHSSSRINNNFRSDNHPTSSSSNRKNLEDIDPPDDDPHNINTPTLVGTCPFMCPVEERLQRERLRDLAVFERLNGNPSKSSPELAVKKFCRTISSKNVQASDVRPLSVLVDTLNYLLCLWRSGEYPFELAHDFLSDRTRSIRQDLSMQNLCNDRVISMYEEMVEFHVISDHKIRHCSGNTEISSKCYLNMEQLTKTLMSLYSLYEANRNAQSMYPREAEFRSLYVLLHLHSDSQRDSLPLWFSHVSSCILNSKEMHFARNVLRYFRLGNFKRFIYIIEAEASYLQYCILEPYINEVRALAIACINNGAYKLQPFPLLDLSKLLMMKQSELESFCKDCGLLVSWDELEGSFMPTKQTTFSLPKRELRQYYPLDSERFLERISGDNVGIQ